MHVFDCVPVEVWHEHILPFLFVRDSSRAARTCKSLCTYFLYARRVYSDCFLLARKVCMYDCRPSGHYILSSAVWSKKKKLFDTRHTLVKEFRTDRILDISVHNNQIHYLSVNKNESCMYNDCIDTGVYAQLAHIAFDRMAYLVHNNSLWSFCLRTHDTRFMGEHNFLNPISCQLFKQHLFVLCSDCLWKTSLATLHKTRIAIDTCLVPLVVFVRNASLHIVYENWRTMYTLHKSEWREHKRSIPLFSSVCANEQYMCGVSQGKTVFVTREKSILLDRSFQHAMDC